MIHRFHSLLALLVWCCCVFPLGAAYSAVVIGLSDYSPPAGVVPSSLDYGKQDAEAVYVALGRLIHDPRRLKLLVNQDLAAVKEEVRKSYRLLSTSDTLLLFVSAHGFADDLHLFDGGICVQCTPENYSGNVFSIEAMKQLFLGFGPPRRVVFLLDVLRTSEVGQHPNRINKAFTLLSTDQGTNNKIGGLTATENDKSRVDRSKSVGLFAHALVTWVDQAVKGSSVPTDSLPRFVQKQSGQAPQELNRNFGDLLPISRSPSLGSMSQPWRFVPATFHGAALPLLFPLFQLAGLAETDSVEAIRQAIQKSHSSEESHLLGSDGAYAQLLRLDPRLNAPDLLPLREEMAQALEAFGQGVLRWYASGNDFAFESPQLLASKFARAGDSFRIAADLRKGTVPPYWEDELRTKGNFCEGRSLAVNANTRDQARTLLQKAALAKLRIAEPFNALGLIDFEARENNHGRSHFEKALAVSPAWSLARHNLALSYAESGNYEQAIREYRRALAVTPQHGYLWHNLGLIQQRLGRNDDAHSSYATALLRFQQQEKEYASLAGSPDTSPIDRQRSRDRATAARLNQSQTLNALGILFASQRKIARAHQQYDAALNLIPQSDQEVLKAPLPSTIHPRDLPPAVLQAATIEHNRALLYSRSRPTEAQALAIWEKLRNIQFAPAEPAAAELYFRRGDFAQAAGIYRQLADREPAFRLRLNAACTQLRRTPQNGPSPGDFSPCPLP